MVALFSVPFLLLLSLAHASSEETQGKTILELLQKNKPALKSFYIDLHENPELSGEEKRTAQKFGDALRLSGYQVIDNIGGFGVAGVMKNGSGPVTLIRAELDGLPLVENTGLSYQSKVPGKMHACGHDFHMTTIVGAAQVMASMKDQWKGTLVVIGQPAEETLKGASAMIEDGLFKKVPRPDRLMAVHTSGRYPKGTIAITNGFALANSDSVDVEFRGRGSHGSLPEKSIDPFMMAAEFVLKTQTLVGREIDALQPALISIGSIHGGTKHNIIPDNVKLELTMRSYDKDVREHLKKRIVEVANGIAATARAPKPVVSFPHGVEATFNDPQLADETKNVLTKKFGDKKILKGEPALGGEDFGKFGLAVKAPSLFMWVGQLDEKDPTISGHSAKYAPEFDRSSSLAIDAVVTSLLHFHALP